MKNQSNELFFVEVQDSGQVRKNILEALREILEVLHRFETFKDIRHRRLENINKLRELVRNSAKMVSNLRTKLPQTSLRATILKEAPPKLKAEQKKEKRMKPAERRTEKPPKKDVTEIEKLESELSVIENRLKDLT